MRPVAVLLLLWAILVMAAVWCAVEGRETELVEQTTRSHHIATRKLPLESFLRDRANRIRGSVIDKHGLPVFGVRVEVYDQETSILSLREGKARQWAAVEPQAATVTGPDGKFELRDLTCGCKTVSFLGERGLVEFFPVVVADGYGAEDLKVVLPEATQSSWLLLEEQGIPASGETVLLLPPGFTSPPLMLQSSEAGHVVSPIALLTGKRHLLVGRPAVMVELATHEETAPIILPPRRPLPLHVEGALDGHAELTFLPNGARRLGLHRVMHQVRDQRMVIPEVRCGRFEVLVAQGGRVGQAEILHDGSEQYVLLSEPITLSLSFRNSPGQHVPIRASWQSVPFLPTPVMSREARTWIESVDPTLLMVESALGGAELGPLPCARGWVLIESPGFVPVIHKAFPGAKGLELPMDQAVELCVRAESPHLPVQIEARDLVQASYTDAAGEGWFFVAPGPVIAREMDLQGESYPVGVWASVDDQERQTLHITRQDKPGRPSGCVYGFVAREGNPAFDQPVGLELKGHPPTWSQTDNSGFYRFTGVASGACVVVVGRVGTGLEDVRLNVQIPVEEPGRPNSVRCDIDLPPADLAHPRPR